MYSYLLQCENSHYILDIKPGYNGGNEGYILNKPKYIETELGREKLCIECQEYWPLDDEFWFHRNVKLLSGKMSKRYESACKCCYHVRYKPHRIKGTNKIKSKHEAIA